MEKGFPEIYRERFWKLITQVDKMKNRNSGLYDSLLEEVNEHRYDDDKLIETDSAGVFAGMHIFFGPMSPGNQCLQNTMKAFLRYKTEASYAGGMLYPLAIFLIYLQEEDAFWAYVKFWQLFHETSSTLSHEIVYHTHLHTCGLAKCLPKIKRYFVSIYQMILL